MSSFSNCVPKFTALSKIELLQAPEKSRNNLYVSGEEKRELTDSTIVNDAIGELALYDDTIVQLQDLMDKLRHERQTLHYHVESTRSLGAPIRKIPADVLSEIFVHHGDENRIESTWGPNPPVSINHIPAFTITSVCKFWRETALATAHLWTRIRLRTMKPHHHVVSLIQLLLDNSRNAELDVVVDLGSQRNGEDANLPFALLCQHSAKWRSFHAVLDSSNPYQNDSLSSIRGSLVSLKKLVLYDGGPVSSLSAPVRWQNIFAACPRLTQFAGFPPNLKLPYKQITHARIHLAGPSWHEQITRLPSLKSVELTIFKSNLIDRRTAFTSPVQELTLAIRTGANKGDFQPLLQWAVFPRLETLTLEGFDEVKNPLAGLPIHDFRGFLNRSSCTITTLRFMNTVVCSTLVELLSTLPTVTDFILHSVRPLFTRSTGQERVQQDDNANLCQIIRRMTVILPSTSQSSVLFPRLTSLEIHCPGGEELDDQLLLNMIKSRCCARSHGNVQVLKFFDFFRRDRPFSFEFIYAMLCLKQSGLMMLVRDSVGDIGSDHDPGMAEAFI